MLGEAGSEEQSMDLLEVRHCFAIFMKVGEYGLDGSGIFGGKRCIQHVRNKQRPSVSDQRSGSRPLSKTLYNRYGKHLFKTMP